MLSDLRTAARDAYIYTLPLIEVATTRQRGLGLGQTMGTITHVRNLATPKHRAVTTPNTDTLYSTAHIDLSAGPVTITLPPAGERYLSLALMDAYTNNFAVLGTRTTGPDGGTFRLVGPREAAEGWNLIRSPTDHVWALARVLVEGPHDLDAARQVQAGVSLQAPAAAPPGPYAGRKADWAEYFASAAKLMAANPPPVTDLGYLQGLAPLGLLEGFDPGRFSADEAAEIAAGLEDGRKAVRGGGGLGGGASIQGWSYPSAKLGDFEQDYGLRAAVALGGLAALPPTEAMYLQGQGPEPGKLFDGRKAWRLHFPADGHLPVDSFWSLSLYEATDDGQYFFWDNPLNRYAIGDRSPGLVANADGSLDIWIGNESPGAEREANWLPAPPAPFAVFMRAYLPRAELLQGYYRMPPLEVV
ncbi:MAG: phosphatidylserine decarboxylase [Phenylobacterium sp. SCN 70-31]|nr:MAG: phosphatidylserine decarboxylase [Phenylobacterium sp. SCN 70-31]